MRFRLCVILVAALPIGGCRSVHAGSEPSIEITRIPPAGDGSPEKVESIEGRVKGGAPGENVVLFALAGQWWVQPLADHPYTPIQTDSTWRASTHPGYAYAALLVDSRYRPPLVATTLPEKGGPVLAIATSPGAFAGPPETVPFSGYQWEVRRTPGSHGGSVMHYDNSAVWTDQRGFLHLRVSRHGNDWMGSEVKLTRSLGYGTYRFVVEELSQLEPAAVFALFTWDDLGPPREMDIEISRWGEPEDKNVQFVVQPYVVPANTVRFDAPAGTVTYWMDWEPGRVSFRASRGAVANGRSDAIAEHIFTSGVPVAGNEKIHLNAYSFANRRHPLQHEFEIVVENFEFLP